MIILLLIIIAIGVLRVAHNTRQPRPKRNRFVIELIFLLGIAAYAFYVAHIPSTPGP